MAFVTYQWDLSVALTEMWESGVTHMQFVEQHCVCCAVAPWLRCFPELLLSGVPIHRAQLEETV